MFTDCMLSLIITLIKFLFNFFFNLSPKCNNNTIDGCHLAQHEELLKPQQVLLGSTSSRPTMPVLASTIPHVGLKATINCIVLLVLLLLLQRLV